MADAFPIDEAQIVALFLESLFYGAYLVSFGLCIFSLVSRGRNTGYRRWPLFLVALLLFTFATLDVAFLVRHVLDAFVWFRGPGGPDAEFADISYWVNVMKTVCYVAQTTVADGMLIYRCFVVYARNWYLAGALCVLWLAGMIVEGFTCYIEFTLHQSAFLNAGALAPFITSVLSITLVLNLLATTLIVARIWALQRRSAALFADARPRGGGSLARAMRIVIESGAMYSLAVVAFFAVYLSNNNAQYAVSDCVVQIIGIAFNLIIIRVDRNKTIETGSARAEAVSLHFARARTTGTGVSSACGAGSAYTSDAPKTKTADEGEEEEERALGGLDA